MAEWPKATVLKTVEAVSPSPWVQIPLPPPRDVSGRHTPLVRPKGRLLVDVAGIGRLIIIDILAICVAAIVIGGSAPRWPARWLQRDRGPLRLTRWDTTGRYRAMGIGWWARVLPEGGSWMGGESKSALPGRDAASLRSYLVEVRRGEWVHFLMMFAWVPLLFFNPWWLTLLFAVVVVIINSLFLLVLRYNQLRLTALLARMTR